MITGDQIRMARAAIRWTVAELAEAARLQPNTVSRIENGTRGGHATSMTAIQSALEAAGVRFVDDGERIGVTVAKAG